MINVTLEEYEAKVLVELLEIASDKFSNHVCNDFELTYQANLTMDEAKKMNTKAIIANGEKVENFDLETTYSVYGDFGLMSYFASLLKKHLFK